MSTNTVSPLHTNFKVANFQRLERAPVYQLLYYTFQGINIVRLKLFYSLRLFFMYYLCGQDYKSDSWVPRLTCWIYEQIGLYKLTLGIHSYVKHLFHHRLSSRTRGGS